MTRDPKHPINYLKALTFGISEGVNQLVYRVCYESYELGQVRYFQGIVGKGQGLQNRRSQLPSSPSCDYSNRLSTDTLVADTI